MGHCLGCVPVRIGVLAFSYFILFLSICAVAGLVTEDTRILVGGYAPWSNWFTDVLGCAGVVLSLMSLMGVYDNHQSWVKYFAYFASIRLFLRFFILWADWGMLVNCEKFGLSSIGGNYNAAMETVVLHGQCTHTRVYYGIISTIDIFISLYGLWNVFFWISVMENGPRYHISLDDTKPLRIYTGYSSVGHPEAPPIHVIPPTSEPQQNTYTTASAFPKTSQAYPSAAPTMGPVYSAAHLAPPSHPGYSYGAMPSRPF
jgi:hypothetical protein